MNDLENVYLYDIDDLHVVVSANIKEREKEAENAMNFISQEVTKFNNWVGALDAVPTIVEIRKKAENIRKQEIEKTLKKISHLFILELFLYLFLKPAIKVLIKKTSQFLEVQKLKRNSP